MNKISLVLRTMISCWIILYVGVLCDGLLPEVVISPKNELFDFLALPFNWLFGTSIKIVSGFTIGLNIIRIHNWIWGKRDYIQ